MHTVSFPLNCLSLLIESIEWRVNCIANNGGSGNHVTPFVLLLENIRHQAPDSAKTVQLILSGDHLELANDCLEDFLTFQRGLFVDDAVNELIGAFRTAEESACGMVAKRPPQRESLKRADVFFKHA